jgi:photosystem II stability/assembly factor-like uncharacterized protein
MRGMRKLLVIPFLVAIAGCGAARAQIPEWTVATSGIVTNLRGVSTALLSRPRKVETVWASGSNGVILRYHGGQEWKRLHIEGGDALDFRGVRAIDENVAYVMSSGEGDKSRIYKTVDGGETWEMQYTDKRPSFFLDDIVCFTATHCFVLGDPIDGKFLILSTEDGKHWQELPRDNMPAIIPNEGAFAASGSSLAIYGTSEIYFGTGGGATARVFHSADLGRTWTVSDTPLAAGNASSGVFSLVRVKDTVIAVGGDYRSANGTSRVTAVSKDAGLTWRLSKAQPSGYRSAVASRGGTTLVCVGPNGSDLSADLGETWRHVDSMNLNAVVVSFYENVWGVGSKGTVANLFDSLLVDTSPDGTVIPR